jgi:hypothetical protein
MLIGLSDTFFLLGSLDFWQADVTQHVDLLNKSLVLVAAYWRFLRHGIAVLGIRQL